MAKGRKQKFGEETQILTIRVPKSISKEKLKEMRILVQKIARYQDPIRLLKSLYVLMNDKMNFEKTPENDDIELIKEIETVIK